jgi:hypothetical protein
MLFVTQGTNEHANQLLRSWAATIEPTRGHIMKVHRYLSRYGYILSLGLGLLSAAMPACSGAGSEVAGGESVNENPSAEKFSALERRLTEAYDQAGPEGVAELAKADPQVLELLSALDRQGFHDDLQQLGQGVRDGNIELKALLSGDTSKLTPELRTTLQKLDRVTAARAEPVVGATRPMVAPVLVYAAGVAIVAGALAVANAGQNYFCCSSCKPCPNGPATCSSSIGSISFKDGVEVAGAECSCACAPAPTPDCPSGTSIVDPCGRQPDVETWRYNMTEYQTWMSVQPTNSFIPF